MSIKLQVIMEIPGKEASEFNYEFDQKEITMGREEDNDIQIPLSTVSRRHATLFNEGGEWFLQDNNSTHGMKHNGKLVNSGGKKLLRSGDTIDIVHFHMTVELDSSLAADYSAEHTAALAQKMVEEVLASLGKTDDLPYLRVMNGPEEGKVFRLTPNLYEVVIGRGNDCDFQINDANISRRHAMIKRDWSDITIEDLGSKNGLLVNDKRILKSYSLSDADEIMLGAMRLTFIDPSAKFLGKLDDIPVFADATKQKNEANQELSVDNEQVGIDDKDSVVGDQSPDILGDEAQLEEDFQSEIGEEPLPENAQEESQSENDESENDEPKSVKAIGSVEMAMIAGVAITGIGVAIGIAFLFMD